MNIRDLLTDGVIIAIVYGLFKVVELAWNNRKQQAEQVNIESQGDLAQAQAFALLRTQVEAMEGKIIILRGRVDALEQERDATLRKLNELRVYVRGLLRQLDAQGVQYNKPKNGLLDTGEHQAVK